MNRRVQAFFTVGAIGFALQLGSLALLTMAVGWPYGPATAIAVELAVVHNFVWHERWTWRDRTIPMGAGRRRFSRHGVIARFARYQVTTGATSMAGNLLCMLAFVDGLGLPVLAANLVAVVTMSVANFLAADRWVFARRAIAVGTLVAASAPYASAAEPRPETLKAWDRYVADTESRIGQREPVSARLDHARGEAISVPGGKIHHWRGATLIRGVTVDAVVRGLTHPGTPPPQDDVLASRVLAHSGDSLRVYLKLVRRTIMTVTYDTEHEVTFRRHGPGLATSRSVATRIAEIGGDDRGFLWRLNSYWRYVQVGNDVRVELESLSLSRDVPAVLKPVAGPIINRIGRESVNNTLHALRSFFERA